MGNEIQIQQIMKKHHIIIILVILSPFIINFWGVESLLNKQCRWQYNNIAYTTSPRFPYFPFHLKTEYMKLKSKSNTIIVPSKYFHLLQINKKPIFKRIANNSMITRIWFTIITTIDKEAEYYLDITP